MEFLKTAKYFFTQWIQKLREEAKAPAFATLANVMKVVEPNHDLIITFEFTTPEQYKQQCIDELIFYAEYQNCNVTVLENKVTVEAPDYDTAEFIRKGWSQL